MPAAVAVPAIATAIAGGAAAGASIYGAHRQGEAAANASQIEDRATRRALQFQMQQADESRRQFDVTEAENRRRADQERADLLDQQAYLRDQTAQRQQRVAPYTGLGLGALAQLSTPIYRPGTGTLADLMQRRS